MRRKQPGVPSHFDEAFFPDGSPPSVDTLNGWLQEDFEEMCQSVVRPHFAVNLSHPQLNDILSKQDFISLTADGWSQKERSYFALMAHFIPPTPGARICTVCLDVNGLMSIRFAVALMPKPTSLAT